MHTLQQSTAARRRCSPDDTGARRLRYPLTVYKRLQLSLVRKASKRVWTEVLHSEVSPHDAREDLSFRLLSETKLREYLQQSTINSNHAKQCIDFKVDNVSSIAHTVPARS